MNTMSKELKIATHFLTLILENRPNITPEGLKNLIEVREGNKEVIKEHLKAIKSIIDKAIKELEK